MKGERDGCEHPGPTSSTNNSSHAYAWPEGLAQERVHMLHIEISMDEGTISDDRGDIRELWTQNPTRQRIAGRLEVRGYALEIGER